ncbi:MAG: hypothetical protein HYZ69_04230, partial [Candidatus Colwellbacteria bacterium]|nr:hypothetical protein [Candidatus Colwellbacteria bacterium]
TVRAKYELDELHYFYDLSKKWRVQWLADRYLFRDSPFYEVADFYLIRNWNEVIKHLQENLDDPRAYHYGNARFRDAQRKYQSGGKKEKGEAVEFVTKEVGRDYEKALRNCLESEPEYLSCFDQAWNYDLTTNKNSAEEALKQPMRPPKFILGPLKGKVPGFFPDNKKKELGGKSLDEEKGGGSSEQKRP